MSKDADAVKVEEESAIPSNTAKYKKRRILMREDHIAVVDKIAVTTNVLFSSILEEALDVYMAFLAKHVKANPEEEPSDEEIDKKFKETYTEEQQAAILALGEE